MSRPFGRLKNYTIKATKNGEPITIDVVGTSKDDARRAAEKRHDYKLSGITVKGPF